MRGKVLDKQSVKWEVSMGSGHWERLLLLSQLECSILNRFIVNELHIMSKGIS